MLRVKGVYDGAKIVLLESVSLLPDTPVEVLIPEPEKIYWQRLLELGLVRQVHVPSADDELFTPVGVTGAPVSQTLIEERR